MFKSYTLLCLVVLISCGKGKSVKLHDLKQESLSTFVNEKNLNPEIQPNLTLDKAVVNNDYPITIALYKDNQFYYDLPNLSDGHGTWSYENGKIVLKAKQKFFDMYIEMFAGDEGSQTLAIQFTDRFGSNKLNMINSNL